VAIVVGVLVVVGGGVAAALLLLGGGDDASTSSPQDTVDSFAQAMDDADCDALESLVTDDFKASADCDPKSLEENGMSTGLEGLEVTEESADSAVATMTDGGVTYEMHLVNEDGDWLINEFSAGTTAPTSPEGADADQDDSAEEGEVLEPDLPDQADAQAMVETYVDALEARDCPTVTELSSRTLKSSMSCVDGLLPPAGADVVFGKPRMVTTTAAKVSMTLDGEKSSVTLMLTQEDNGWKVTSVDIG
jgi:hypothetical protein